MPTERLQQYASGLLGRVDAVQQSLRSLLSEGIQQRLAAAHWPPPLSVSAEGAAAAPAADDGRAWRGFAAGAGGQAAVAELQQLLVMLLTLQRASQHEQFRCGLVPAGPLLLCVWCSDCLSWHDWRMGGLSASLPLSLIRSFGAPLCSPPRCLQSAD